MYFTQIPDKLKYPANIRAKLSSIHSIIVEYVVKHFSNTRKYKLKVLDVINNLSYHVLIKDDLDQLWNQSNPLQLTTIIDNSIIKKNIGEMYLDYSDVKFDVEDTDDGGEEVSDTPKPKSFNDLKAAVESKDHNSNKKNSDNSESNTYTTFTQKEDLYIKYPTVPQFKYGDVYASGYINGELYSIYNSLPIIPTRQSEISATTNIDLMSESDLLNLYPNRFIRTRDECMYDNVPGIYQHELLGNIIPIEGYSRDELIDNIVRYPHIFRLCRIIDDQIVNMYNTIEINGELQRTLDVWESLPESSVIPRTAAYIKEYVVRRYLLEREHGVSHNYPIFGTFEEFTTLFMPTETYIQMGYDDIVGMAKQCVKARINYKRSRNPILRGLGIK